MAIESWFNESKETAIDVVDSVYLKKGPKTGHFIQMSHDANSRVGCAASHWDSPKNNLGVERNIQLTCHYFKSAEGGSPLYEIGTPCERVDCKCNQLKLCEPNVTTFKETYMQDLDSLPIPEF